MTGNSFVTPVNVRRLSKVFGNFTAVDQISFEVRKGEVFGFLGPNGAGKTTTIKMLTGLLLPSSGGGTVAGFDLLTEAESIKRRIGYMSQLFSLYADLTVEENIAFFSGLNGVPRNRRAERKSWVLEMADLTDHQRQLTRDLPLGWKQRLALGCAVLHEPPILFLDEPTSGVDPISRRKFWDLIDALAGKGTTIMVSTHYMEEAEHCHRLALMNRARMIALNTPSGIRSMMPEPILELHTSNSLRTVEVLRDLPGITEAALFGRAIHVTAADTAHAYDIISAALASHGITIEKSRRISPSLEDVFVSLVQKEGGALLG